MRPIQVKSLFTDSKTLQFIASQCVNHLTPGPDHVSPSGEIIIITTIIFSNFYFC